MKPFKITLKLNPEASPHLYVRRINELIAEDEYLHPMLKNLLLTLRKAHMPYIRLSLEKELVISPELHCHFERAIQPEAMPWSKIDWEEDEIIEFEENKKQYIKNILKLQEKIGYDFFNKKDVEEKEIDDLIEITKKKFKKNKKWWNKTK